MITNEIRSEWVAGTKPPSVPTQDTSLPAPTWQAAKLTKKAPAPENIPPSNHPSLEDTILQAKLEYTILQTKKAYRTTGEILTFADKIPKKFTGYRMWTALKVVPQTFFAGTEQETRAHVAPMFFLTTARQINEYTYQILDKNRVLDESCPFGVLRTQLAVAHYIKGNIEEIIVHENVRSKIKEITDFGGEVLVKLENDIYEIESEGKNLRVKLYTSKNTLLNKLATHTPFAKPTPSHPLLRAFAEKDSFHRDLQGASRAMQEKCKYLRDPELYEGVPDPIAKSRTFYKIRLDAKIHLNTIDFD